MQNFRKNYLKLYAVTDRSWLKPGERLADVVEELLKAGVSCVQLREKEADDATILQEATELKAVCSRYRVPLIINDRPDLVKMAGADGVHVGLSDIGIEKARQMLGDGYLIGGSAHNVEEALAAQKSGADYIGCGAVFGSTTKTDAATLSTEVLQSICQSVTIPVVAIGGIHSGNIGALSGTGIDGVAVISALFGAEDKTRAVRNLLHRVDALKVHTALTIAGSDSSGGAGIQADIKTMTVHSVYAMSAVTALTAQNTTGIYGIQEVSPDFLEKQLDCIFTDIIPDAVKIGMLPGVDLIKVTAQKLRQYQVKHVVLDPVMVSTSGSKLIQEEAVQAMQKELFPLAELITPNIPETEVLTARKIEDEADMEQAARLLYERFHCAVLCKGGHRAGDANDLLYGSEEPVWFKGERIDNPNTHGTGCTLSSAIACNLAKGYGLAESVQKAKEYLAGVLRIPLSLGRGTGPLYHSGGMFR